MSNSAPTYAEAREALDYIQASLNKQTITPKQAANYSAKIIQETMPTAQEAELFQADAAKAIRASLHDALRTAQAEALAEFKRREQQQEAAC